MIGKTTSAPSSPVLVAHTASGLGLMGGTSSAVDTTGATFIAVHVSAYIPVGTLTMTDNKGNTWTSIQIFGTHGDYTSCWFFCFSPTSVGSGHTFTYSSEFNTYPSMEVLAFSGISTASVDHNNGTTTTSSSTGQTGSITPGTAHTLVLSGTSFGDNSGGSVSINSSYTLTDSIPNVNGSYLGSAAAYKVLTSSSAQNPTWDVTNSNPMVTSTIADFAY